MKKNLYINLLFLFGSLFFNRLHSQVSLTATSGTLSGSYTTLKGAFDKVNDGTHQGLITLSITANTLETASAVLNNSGNGASSYTSVSISPSGGAARTISGSITTYLIDLNGADNVTINGLNSGSNSLTIQNTSITSGASAIRFVSDATNNTIQNTTLKSTAPGAAGVVFFSTGSNSNNTVTSCNIDGSAGAIAAPANAAQMGIYSTGTGNNNITVSNCNIYDCFVNGQTASHGGIYASSGSSAWTITGNSIYQTSTRTVTANTTYYGIAIANASAVGNTISSNYIGGSSASCGGSKFTIAGSYDNIFHGVYVNVGTASASNVQGNTIANLSITSTAASTNFFYGINVQGGYVNVGSTTGNTIGNNSVDASSSANISLSAVISAQTATALGIYASATTLAVSNNNIGGINFTNTNNSYGGKFYAIRTATSSAAMSITSNVIGSTSTATNIKLGSSSTTSGVFEFYGIANAATGVMTINSNTVKNIIVYGTGTAASLIAPIYNTGATDNSTISNNIISTISNSGTGSGGINYGIYQSAVASFTLVNNIISSYTINNGSFNGLCLNVGSTNSKTFTITSNTIKSITAALTTGANTVGKYCGIYISSNGNTYNLNTNLIQSLSGTNSTSYYYINGIYTVGVTNQPLINLSGNIIEKLINGSTSTGSTNSVYGVEITSTSSSSSIIKKNIIRYLAMSGATTNSNISGISLSSTNNTLENNFVRINNDDGTSTFATIRTVIKGLSTPGSGATNVLYYNTIVIGGTTPDLVNTQSYCVYIPTGGTHTMKNNIFQNTRVGNTSNLGNYTLYTGSAGGSTTTFNNNYYANTTSSTFAFYNGSAKSESTYNNTLYGGTSSSFSLTGLTIATDGAVTETASITGIIDLYTTGGTDCREDLYGNSLIRNVSGQSGAHQGCYESGQSNYYWVAGTGNWSDYSNHWAFVSGGPACATAVPSSSSNVYFDANSSAGTCTIDAAATCLNFTGTGYTGIIAGTFGLTISRDLIIGSGMTWSHTGTTTFNATSTGKTITTNSVSLACPIAFNGSGGGWTLQDALTTTSSLTFTAGTLSTGGFNINVGTSWTNNGGTYTHGSNTVTFTGTGTIGGSSSTTFYNLSKSTAGTTILGIAQTVSNDLTISAGTLSSSSYNLTIGGNWVNDGTFNAGTGRVTFNGSFSKTVSGSSSTAFYELEVDKGTSISTVLEITVPASITNNCVFTDGLLKLSHASITATDAVTATTDISATSGLHINGATYSTSSNAVLNNSGYFRVSSGTATVGTASDNTLYNESATSVFILDGGVVNCYGRFRAANGSVSISSGTLTIGTGSIDNIATRGGFEIETGSDFSMIGGTVVLQSRNLNASGNDLYIVSGGTKVISGGTIQIGNASTVASRIFKINSDIALYNLTINLTNSPTGILQQNTTVLNNFTNNGIFDANSSGPYNLTITGSFINNGTFSAQTGMVTFNGASAQTITGTTDPNFYNFTLDNDSGASISLNTTVQSAFIFTRGKFTAQGFTLTIGTNGTNGSVSGYTSAKYFIAYYNGGTIGNIKQFINLKTSTPYVYPIGDLSKYTPFTMTVNAATTLAPGAYFTMYTNASKIAGLSTAVTTYLTRYWSGTDFGISTPNYDISYSYSVGDVVVGDEANLMPIKKSLATWYKPTGSLFTNGIEDGTNSSYSSLTRTLSWGGLTTFSDYGAVGPEAVLLPIELIYFKGKKIGNDNLLVWSTQTEFNNDYFTIEKTIDGYTFELVGTQNGSGTTNSEKNYTLIDKDVQKVINYYRLIQTDIDGKNTISDLISIDNRGIESSVKVISSITNILGQEINENYKGIVIIKYTDGSFLKTIR